MTNGEAIREKLKGTILETLTDENISEIYDDYYLDCEKCSIKEFCLRQEIRACSVVVLDWLLSEQGLKSCPFCGCKVELEDREFEDYAGNSFPNTMSVIECKNCGISMKAIPKAGYGTTKDQKENLIRAWNARKGGEQK